MDVGVRAALERIVAEPLASEGIDAVSIGPEKRWSGSKRLMASRFVRRLIEKLARIRVSLPCASLDCVAFLQAGKQVAAQRRPHDAECHHGGRSLSSRAWIEVRWRSRRATSLSATFASKAANGQVDYMPSSSSRKSSSIGSRPIRRCYLVQAQTKGDPTGRLEADICGAPIAAASIRK